MNNKPIFLHHYGDIRETIFQTIETLFRQYNHVHVAPNSGYSFVLAHTHHDTTALELCSIGLVRLPTGVLIETAFPNQPKVHNRVWMIDANFGQITYIEITNPDLRHSKELLFGDPDNNALELHAMPSDLRLLQTILTTALSAIKSTKYIGVSQPMNMQYMPLLTQ
ncbi:hypothetical protein KC871_00290 [Candidatus Saccharibacteria bacterium]|nr:hypothetical protein [Candidatus Saccharibacteria bacterium]MCB9817130.1 hypothetical protein [Candidatus Nomurabacteria bacterium]HPD99044.1 hypothetical protein [Candidatus Saccharibacteria bacterium]